MAPIDKKMMRDTLIEQIYQRMQKNDSIFFISADFGAPALDAIRETFADRFINVGIAEQNLINVSAGLALEGYTVFAYAIAPFITMRCFEQVRTNIAMHAQLKQINVNMVGVGAGVSYDVSGPSHHCLEDLSIMRTLPHIEVFSPSEWTLVERFVDHAIGVKRPKYLRFDSKPMPALHRDLSERSFKDGFVEMCRGEEVCLVSTGYMTHKALSVAEELTQEGISVGVADIFFLRPIQESRLVETLGRYAFVITLEEAFINKGGLDGLIADILDRHDSRVRLAKIGFGDAYVFEVGDREYLHRLNHLDKESIKANVKRMLRAKSLC